MLRVSPHVVIHDHEISYRTSTSGGPGGQHANKNETAVEVIWDTTLNGHLSERDRQRLHARLGRHLVGHTVVVGSAEHRSQHRNREEALDKLVEVVSQALRRPKRRKKTRPTRASQRRRLESKRRRGRKKELRGRVRREPKDG